MIRPQTILTLIVVVVVIFFGIRTVTDRELDPTPTPTAIAQVAPTQVPPTAIPTLEPTNTPRPQPTATSEPTPTEEPEATERPEPPETGQDDSLIIERGDSGRVEVALTFDAGEGAGHTEAILDMLDEAGIKGTFGVTGAWVEENPELTLRIVEEGHMLINHTYDHASWNGNSTGTEPLDDAQRLEEIKTTEQIILDTTGYESKPYFRFPYGDYDGAALTLLGENGYSYTLWWSCDTQGWNGYSPETIVEICGPDADDGGPGAIILMHVADDNDFAALPALIEAYSEAGYDFVTCEEIIQP